MEHVYVMWNMRECECVCEIVIAAGLIHEAYVTIIMRLVNGPWLINKFYTEGITKIENKEQSRAEHKAETQKTKHRPKKQENKKKQVITSISNC